MNFLDTCLVTRTLVTSLLILATVGCSEVQEGKYFVQTRYVKVLGKSGRVDLFRGGESQKSGNDILAAFVSYSSRQNFDKINEISGDGIVVSTLNLSYHRSKPPTFSFAMAWNRTNDTVHIDDRSFKRNEGTVFIIHEKEDGRKVVYQIRLDSSTKDNEAYIDEILELAIADVPELKSFRKPP
jgi:hypothetical protein